MTKVVVDFTDVERRVFVLTKKITPAMRAGSRKALYAVGRDLTKTLKRQLRQKNKTGRTYLVKIGGRLKRHISSGPGQTPANLTGRYSRSINYKVQGHDELLFMVNTPYAHDLEFGNERRNLLPRPGLKNSINENIRNIEQHIERISVQEILKK